MPSDDADWQIGMRVTSRKPGLRNEEQDRGDGGMTGKRPRNGCWLLTTGFLLLALLGCEPKTGEISGRVTYRGQPLPYGTLMFYCSDQQILSRLIGPDGCYEASGIPTGLVRIAIRTYPPIPPGYQIPQRLPPSRTAPNLGRAPTNEALGNKGLHVKIPGKYSNPEESGLMLEVSEGQQTFMIDLGH
jgi:hypothetical protein